MIRPRTTDQADLEDKPSAVRPRRTVGRCETVPLVWSFTASERAKTFEVWERLAMRCLRSSPIGFAAIVSLRKSLRSDGTVTATNRELVAAAGSSAKAFDRDLSRLKSVCLIDLQFGPQKGISGARRTIRLSLPSKDEGDAT